VSHSISVASLFLLVKVFPRDYFASIIVQSGTNLKGYIWFSILFISFFLLVYFKNQILDIEYSIETSR